MDTHHKAILIRPILQPPVAYCMVTHCKSIQEFLTWTEPDQHWSWRWSGVEFNDPPDIICHFGCGLHSHHLMILTNKTAQESTNHKKVKKVSDGTNAVFRLPAEFYSKPVDTWLIVLQQISYHSNCHRQSLWITMFIYFFCCRISLMAFSSSAVFLTYSW